MLVKARWNSTAKHSWMFARNIASGLVFGWTLYKTKRTAVGWLYIHLGIHTLTICLGKQQHK